MSVTKVRACSTLNAMNPEQDNIDSLIRQAIGKEPFLSFSRAGDSPVQLIQLLHAFDQQGTDKLSKGSKWDSYDEFKENSDNIFNGVNSFSSDMNVIKDPVHSLKGCESNTNGTKCKPAQRTSHKIPEAVVAFAQAAAKANGEPEKSNLAGWPLLSPSKAQLQKCDKCSLEFCSFINYRRHRRMHRRSLNVDKDSQKNRDILGTFWDKLSVDEVKELVSLRDVTVEEVTGLSVKKALSTWFRRPGVLSSLPQGYMKAGLTLSDVVQGSHSISPISSQELFSVLDEASEKTFLCAGTALSLQKYVFDGETVKKALEIKNIVACTSFLIEIQLVKAWLVDKDAEALRCQKLLVDEEEATQRRQAELLERKRLKKLRQKEQKVNETSNCQKVDLKEGPSLDSPPECTVSTETSSPRDSSEECSSISEASHINQEQLLLEFAESRSSTEDDGNAEKSISNQTQKQQPHHSHNIIYSRPTQSIHNGFQAGTARSSVNTRHNNNNSRDLKVITRPNGRKVWTIKSRPDNEEDGKYGGGSGMAERELVNEPPPFVVVSDRSEVLIGSINVSLGNDDLFLEAQKQEKPAAKPDSSPTSSSVSSRTATKLWIPVSRSEHGGDLKASDVHGISLIPDSADRCIGGPMMFSREAAKVFLALRWEEAIANDEAVVVISSPETEAVKIKGCFGNSDKQLQASDFHGRAILGHVENRLAGVGGVIDSGGGAHNLKFRSKNEKKRSLKYVAKQKSSRSSDDQ